MTSLRLRLFVILLVTTGLLWSLAALWISMNTRDEIQAVLDSRLREAAHMVGTLVGSPETVARLKAGAESGEGGFAFPAADYFDKKLSCQVWSLKGGLVAQSGAAPAERLADHASGFGEKWIDGEKWRVYVLRSPGSGVEIMVGDSIARRDRLVDDIMTGLFVPAVPLLLVLAAVVWVSVSRGLAPLARLAGELSARPADDLSPVRDADAPREVSPLLSALNALFAKVRDARERERAFIDSAAHELRTPLAGVRMQAQVADAARDEESRRNALRRVLQAADRATRLASRLLLLSRLEAGSQEHGEAVPVDLAPHARRILSDLAATGVDAGRVVLDGSLGAHAVLADEGILGLALSNLVENAARHAGAEAAVTVRAERTADGLAIVVEDDGPGVPADELSGLSERFRRGRRAHGEGSGLGLSIAGSAAARLGGRIDLANRPEGGLRAALLLPARAVRPAPDRVRDAA